MSGNEIALPKFEGEWVALPAGRNRGLQRC